MFGFYFILVNFLRGGRGGGRNAYSHFQVGIFSASDDEGGVKLFWCNVLTPSSVESVSKYAICAKHRNNVLTCIIHLISSESVIHGTEIVRNESEFM